MKKIDVEAFKKEGFTYEEIEGIKKGIKDVEEGRVIPFEQVQLGARKKLFSKAKENA